MTKHICLVMSYMCQECGVVLEKTRGQLVRPQCVNNPLTLAGCTYFFSLRDAPRTFGNLPLFSKNKFYSLFSYILHTKDTSTFCKIPHNQQGCSARPTLNLITMFAHFHPHPAPLENAPPRASLTTSTAVQCSHIIEKTEGGLSCPTQKGR